MPEQIEYIYDRDNVEMDVGRQLTDDEWAAVRATDAWTWANDSEVIHAAIHEIISEAVDQANIQRKEG